MLRFVRHDLSRRLAIVLAAVVSYAALAATPAAAQPYITGIDVSLFQDTVDWDTVRSDGIEFAFVRATRGETYDDPLFLANVRQATQAGVLVGPYHFCNLDTDVGNPLDPVNEAEHFLRVIKPYYDAGLMLPPVADVEGFPPFDSTAEARAYTSAWVTTFSDTIYAELGVRPLIYGSLSKVNSYYTPAIPDQHELWLAWWKSTGTANPPAPADTTLWDDWTFWQWTSQWTTPGIVGAVDGDLFNGTSRQLHSLLHGDGPLGGLPAGRLLLSDFNSTEGYFGFAPGYSGSNRNLLNSTTAALSTAEAYEGAGSQRIDIHAAGSNWRLRMLSGIGAPPFKPANPESNLPLAATGSIGFWLKTDDPGVSVQILIDDHPAPSSGGIEGGTLRTVVADGQWHLYEWDLADDDQWNNYFHGDGAIDADIITVDSIRFLGNANATLYLDAVSYNPLGSLQPVAGDFNGDLLVNAADLEIWQSAFGSSNDGDANDNDATEGADFLVWQRNVGAPTIASAALPTPEPRAILLALAAVGGVLIGAGSSLRRNAAQNENARLANDNVLDHSN